MSPRIPRHRILLRSLALQLFLNFRSMQGAGYLLALCPLLRKKELKEGEARAVGSYINGHPVFSSLALGAIAGQLAEGRDVGTEQFTEWKQQISSPLGAIGDSLIWERFKPGLLALLCAALLIAGQHALDLWLYGAVALVVVYNSALWMFREWGFARGLELKERLPELAAHPGLPLLKKALRVLGIVAATAVLAGALRVFAHGGALWTMEFTVGFLVILAAAFLRISTLAAAFISVLIVLGIRLIVHA